ncbi:MAG: hypothetical protein RI967_1756 [Planctomycetota bacterium]
MNSTSSTGPTTSTGSSGSTGSTSRTPTATLRLGDADLSEIAPLGRGHRSAYFRAWHGPTGRLLAIRQILPDAPDPAPELARMRALLARRDALGHPNLRAPITTLRIARLGELPHAELLALEFVDANPRSTKPLAIPELVELVRGAARGLRHLHATGLVHGRVAPHAFLRTPTGRLKIASLGDLTRAGTPHPTLRKRPGLIAPEMAAKEPLTPETDSFLLAVTTLLFATGRWPAAAAAVPCRENAPLASTGLVLPALPAATLCPELPHAIAAFCDEALASDPTRRPPVTHLHASLG